jgi:hypothetical protein
MNADTGWDLIIGGGIGAVVLSVVFGVPMASAIHNNVHERRMRQHFSDTRERRRGVLGAPPNPAERRSLFSFMIRRAEK